MTLVPLFKLTINHLATDEELLAALRFPAQQCQRGRRDAEFLREHLSDCLVRLAIGGWGSRAYLQLAVSYTGYFVVRGARVDAYGNNDIIALTSRTRCKLRVQG
jgi:hypothetical protein